MATIFLSYDHADRERVRPIVDALTGSGMSVWWDRETKPGGSYPQEIADQLKRAACVLVVWSRESVVSEWVQDEAGRAKRRGVLLPALLDDVEDDLPLGFGTRHYVDLRGWNGAADAPELKELVAAVKNASRAYRDVRDLPALADELVMGRESNVGFVVAPLGRDVGLTPTPVEVVITSRRMAITSADGKTLDFLLSDLRSDHSRWAGPLSLSFLYETIGGIGVTARVTLVAGSRDQINKLIEAIGRADPRLQQLRR